MRDIVYYSKYSLYVLLQIVSFYQRESWGAGDVQVYPTTKVLSHTFCWSCLTPGEKEDKMSLNEVHTYAQLKRDPKASLPSSFTICSAIMSPYGHPQLFFSLLGNHGNQTWRAGMDVVDRPGGLRTQFFHKKSTSWISLPVFSFQWVRSCMAINTESGLLQWVVNGLLVENSTLEELKDAKMFPTDLSRKIILGASQSPNGAWWALSNKVADLNIFAGALSPHSMQMQTKAGGCLEDGDYLAWNDMH